MVSPAPGTPGTQKLLQAENTRLRDELSIATNHLGQLLEAGAAPVSAAVLSDNACLRQRCMQLEGMLESAAEEYGGMVDGEVTSMMRAAQVAVEGAGQERDRQAVLVAQLVRQRDELQARYTQLERDSEAAAKVYQERAASASASLAETEASTVPVEEVNTLLAELDGLRAERTRLRIAADASHRDMVRAQAEGQNAQDAMETLRGRVERQEKALSRATRRMDGDAARISSLEAREAEVQAREQALAEGEAQRERELQALRARVQVQQARDAKGDAERERDVVVALERMEGLLSTTRTRHAAQTLALTQEAGVLRKALAEAKAEIGALSVTRDSLLSRSRVLHGERMAERERVEGEREREREGRVRETERADALEVELIGYKERELELTNTIEAIAAPDREAEIGRLAQLLERERQAREDDRAEAKYDRDELSQHLADAERRCDSYIESMDALEAERDILVDQVACLELSLSRSACECGTAQAQAAQAEGALGVARAETESALADMDAQRARHASERDAWRDSEDQYVLAASVTKAQLSNAAAERERLVQERDRSASEVDRLSSEGAQLRQQLYTAQEEARESAATLERVSLSHTHSEADMAQQIQTLEAQVASLTEHNDCLYLSCADRLSDAHEMCALERDSLRQRVGRHEAEAKTQRERADTLEAEVSALRLSARVSAASDALRTDCVAMRGVIEGLREERDALLVRVEQGESVVRRQSEAALTSLREEGERERERLRVDAEAAVAREKAVCAEVSQTLKGQVAARDAELVLLRQKQAEAEKALATLKRETVTERERDTKARDQERNEQKEEARFMKAAAALSYACLDQTSLRLESLLSQAREVEQIREGERQAQEERQAQHKAAMQGLSNKGPAHAKVADLEKQLKLLHKNNQRLQNQVLSLRHTKQAAPGTLPTPTPAAAPAVAKATPVKAPTAIAKGKVVPTQPPTGKASALRPQVPGSAAKATPSSVPGMTKGIAKGVTKGKGAAIAKPTPKAQKGTAQLGKGAGKRPANAPQTVKQVVQALVPGMGKAPTPMSQKGVQGKGKAQTQAQRPVKKTSAPAAKKGAAPKQAVVPGKRPASQVSSGPQAKRPQATPTAKGSAAKVKPVTKGAVQVKKGAVPQRPSVKVTPKGKGGVTVAGPKPGQSKAGVKAGSKVVTPAAMAQKAKAGPPGKLQSASSLAQELMEQYPDGPPSPPMPV
ncbi:hypothetical protein KIPB_001218 [Kipferlia bialata]|uniref:Uncharacterized protein n=1 Tax=Kipferlia bialata TaxID=797122 RepID=A0A9K3CQ87_9EUKA|nr:hypothetical protein KIPB_001218 [Kipferlia bialata]|eukprot:g1218.t1